VSFVLEKHLHSVNFVHIKVRKFHSPYQLKAVRACDLKVSRAKTGIWSWERNKIRFPELPLKVVV